jgi:hypothetical protein
MLLFITASTDATANLLFEKFSLSAFRLNFDLWQDYSVALESQGWEISNPAGLKITDKTATHCFWWKAFVSIDADEFVVAEIKYVFTELYASFSRRGLLVGNPRDFDNHYGKLRVLHTASRYFRTPASLAGWNLLPDIDKFNSHPIVAKSLSSALTSTNKFLFTTAVAYSLIDRTFPWFLQTKIDARDDVTVFVCGNRYWAFSRSRKDLQGLDWRLDADPCGWKPRFFSPREDQNFRALCGELGVEWGRFDLLEDDEGLVFLEFNANGQWAFLDVDGDKGILDAVASYLSMPPRNSMEARRGDPPAALRGADHLLARPGAASLTAGRGAAIAGNQN